MPFHIVRNDIVKMNTDAIVNITDPAARIGTGTEAGIYKAAGKIKLRRERKRLGVISTGDTVITPGFKLPCKYIIHTGGPSYADNRHSEPDQIRDCYEKSLAMALFYSCESVAFPLLPSEISGRPREETLRIALDTFNAFLLTHEMNIYLVVPDSDTAKISGTLFSDVNAYLAEHLTPETSKDESYFGAPMMQRAPVAADSSMSSADIVPDTACAARKAPVPAFAPKDDQPCDTGELPTPADLNDYIRQNDGSFADYLQKLINKKGMTNAEVYKKANLTKQYFSKVINGRVKPAKDKLLCIAVALKLNLDETTDFLRFGGYALSPYNKTDLVFEYFIRNKNFDIFSIDIALFDMGLPSLMD